MEAILNHTEFKIDKSNWVLKKFDEVVEEPRETCKNILGEGIEHVVGLEHIDSGNIHLRKSATIEESTTFSKKFRKGDVLFGRRRAYLKKAAQAEFDGICSGDITVFRAKTGLSSALLPFIVYNDKFFDYAVKHSAGGLSPRVKFKDLANYEFLLPPKDEQARLSELLWAMDEVIEKEKTVLDSNIVLLNSFVEDVIHGRYLNTEGLKNVAIGTIPASWDVVKMEQVLTINDGAHFTPTYVNAGIPFLRVTDVQTSDINLDNVKYIPLNEHQELCKRCKPEKGDILYSKNGTIGISKIINWDWEFSIFVSLALFKIKDKSILDINYLKLILDSAHIKKEIYRKAKHGTITNLHLEEIRVFRLPLPSIEKQREIALHVGNINNLINNCKNKISASQSLQKSLINQIF